MRVRLQTKWGGVLGAIGMMGLAGCGSEADLNTAQLAQALGEADGGADGGGVVLQANVIQGQIRFINQNPQIQTLIDTDLRFNGTVSATSLNPTGFSASATAFRTSSPGSYQFVMSVEAGAGGASGVNYRVTPQLSSVYNFLSKEARVYPSSIQPDPTTANFEECVGVIRFQFGTDETCATSVPISSPSFGGVALRANSNAYRRGGTSGTSTLQ